MREEQKQITMASQETKSPKDPLKETNGILSPGFRSAAAMAGWDEEALLLASLVVEDTPIRESRHKKRPNHHNLKSPASTNSNRKRRSKRRQANDLMPAVVLCLDDEEEGGKKDVAVKKNGVGNVVDDDGDKEKKMKGEENLGANASSSDNNNKGLPCMDRLREELSCAICLEICFEPSTTPCGHSFCKKCLKCAAAKCGKRCPKCRQLISNGRSCTVNTVLWNTIQLLFPNEIEARKSTLSTGSQTPDSHSKTHEAGRDRVRISSARNMPRSTSFVPTTQVSHSMERERSSSRRRASPTQSQDAALALRLQREEFLGTFIGTLEQPRSSLNSARANLRAMASRAYHIRTRDRY